MMKIKMSKNVIWSSLINSSVLGDFHVLNDVVERVNTNTNPISYEYYGIAETPVINTSNSMTVWKLDNTGSAMAYPSQFNSSLGGFIGSPTWKRTQLEIDGNGAAGDGLLAWGNKGGGTEHVYTRSYFNGVTDCDNLSDFNTTQGPGLTISVNVTTSNWYHQCDLFSLTETGISPDEIDCNWSVTVQGSSNARLAQLTSLTNYNEDTEKIRVYPNPSAGSFSLELSVKENMEITLINTLGQFIADLTPEGFQYF